MGLDYGARRAVLSKIQLEDLGWLELVCLSDIPYSKTYPGMVFATPLGAALVSMSGARKRSLNSNQRVCILIRMYRSNYSYNVSVGYKSEWCNL